MDRTEIIEALRQAWRELDFEGSPSADDLAKIIFVLAEEWGIVIDFRVNTSPVERT